MTSDAPFSTLKVWSRILTAPLARLPHPPSRVVTKAGQGLHLKLYDEQGGELHLCLTPCSTKVEAAIKTGMTDLRYLGREVPGGVQHEWLEVVGRALARAETRPGWPEFLRWAFERPALENRGASGASQRLTSGDAVLVRVTKRCNARCGFCNSAGLEPDLQDDAREFLERLPRLMGARASTVSLTGGEPTLRQDLPELVQALKRHGARLVELQSNGILLGHGDLLSGLTDAGLDALFLSLHGCSAEVHDAMLGVPGAFSGVMAAIEGGLGRGLAVSCNCVLCKENLDQAALLVEFLERSFGRGRIKLCLSFMAPQGKALQNLQLLPRLREAAGHMARALEAGEKLGVEVTIPGVCGVPMCLLPGHLERLEEYLDDRPPPRLPARGWGPACAGCRMRPRCSGFWLAYMARYGVEELEPAPKWRRPVYEEG